MREYTQKVKVSYGKQHWGEEHMRQLNFRAM